MNTLEQEIERAAKLLPEGWMIRLVVENGYGGVTAIRPDGTTVAMNDGELVVCEQFVAALQLAFDEAANGNNTTDGKEKPA